MRLHPLYRLAMAHNTGVTGIIIGQIGAWHKLHPVGRNLIGCPIQILGAHGNMLDTLAVIPFEIINNLPSLTAILVDQNPNAPSW